MRGGEGGTQKEGKGGEGGVWGNRLPQWGSPMPWHAVPETTKRRSRSTLNRREPRRPVGPARGARGAGLGAGPGGPGDRAGLFFNSP